MTQKVTIHKYNIVPVSDYIYLRPDKPMGGTFDPGSAYINETAQVIAVGPLVSDWNKALIGKRVIFNAWACDKKTIENDEEVYFATESSNAICAVI